jgi:KUP system potassium uptake protein
LVRSFTFKNLSFLFYFYQGNTFGPLMLIWFFSLFSVGLWRTRLKPSILKAFNPYQAIIYLIKEKKQGFYHIGKYLSFKHF